MLWLALLDNRSRVSCCAHGRCWTSSGTSRSAACNASKALGSPRPSGTAVLEFGTSPPAFVVFVRDPDARISALLVDADDPRLERDVIDPYGLGGWSWGALRLRDIPSTRRPR
jgi:hypothetical protein